MALYITNEEKMNSQLAEQRMLIEQMKKVTSRSSFHWMLRFYSLFSEWLHQSAINKLKIIVKLVIRPFGMKKSIHYGEEFCYYEIIYRNINRIDNTIQQIQKGLNYEYNEERKKACNEIFNMIQYCRSLNWKIICIMAPFFNRERMKDGYYRRIKAIDDIMGNKCLKIYMSSMDCSPMQGANPKVIYVDNEHIQITYHSWIEDEREFVNKIADYADLVYHHGVGFMDEDIIRKKHLLKIVDLHGALPEEFAMNANYAMVQVESIHEELAMKYSDYIICVTNSMRQHMERKYPNYSPNYITIPILDQETLQSKIHCTKKPKKSVPIITYAGGTQKWQRIEKMQECMQMQPNYEYRIFVSNPQEFWATWPVDRKLPSLKVKHASPEELRMEYNECQYGFVIRDDSVVNHVACPTKLIEYLLKGIIPILSTPYIGDFVTYGMQYITVEDFCNGQLPNNEKRINMAQTNQEIIDKIIHDHTLGKSRLQKIIENCEVG